MTYIKRITMSGFKSFGNRTVSVRLAKGFTCIVGPNGNGKSNVIDALCFALGRMSKKTMRAKSLTDLIFAGTKTQKPASKAEVVITFDNKNKEFPDDSEEYNVARWVKAKGTSGYTIQGKKSTREQLLNVLAQANIDPDGSNQFILQGRIVELTHMNTGQRREFIETLIGLEKYDEMKANTLKELEKADADLLQFEAIFKEVSAQLKKVEKEKNDALRWKELDNNVNLYNAQLIALKIHKLRMELEEVEAEMEESLQVIAELEGKVARAKEKLEAEAMFFKGIEGDLTTQEEEKAKLDETLTTQRTELSAKETELKNAKENLKRLEEQKAKLEGMQEKLEGGKTYDDLIKATSDQIAKVGGIIDETTKTIDETVAEQKDREAKIAEINKQISAVQQEIKALSTESGLLEQTITKNNKKLDKLEKDLKRLKKEGESVEEAIKKTQAESDGITKKIEDTKTKIGEEQTRQKELDKEIKKLEKDKEKALKKQGDIQASVSSANAEINMLKTRITELEDKKTALKKEYDRLTKGQKVEDQINALKAQEKTLNEELKTAKGELTKANEEQKKSQGKKDALELKRRSMEAEIADIDKRLSGLKVELKNAEAELKAAEGDKKKAELQKASLEKELKDFTAQKDKLTGQADGINKKLAQYTEDRKKIQEKIDKMEAEKGESSGELEKVMTNLTELIRNLDKAAGDIKSDMQNASQVAIDRSSEVIKTFVMDITDILKSIEEVAGLEESKEIKEQLTMTVDTLKVLIDNADQPISQLNDAVKDASDDALAESTKNFDEFTQEFSNKFDSIRVALKAVAVSDTSEQYKALDAANASIQAQNSALADINNQLTKITTQTEQKDKELKQIDTQLTALAKKIDENKAKVDKGAKENDEKSKQVAANQAEIKKITDELEGLKKFADDFWKTTKDLQAQIDAKTEELTKLQADLNSLANVKRILEDIEAAGKDQERLTKDIEHKTESIKDLVAAADKAVEEVKSQEEHIGKVKADRDAADETRVKLQTEIDAENEKLKDVASRLKDLENVQKLIKDIEALKAENEESTAKIAENAKGIAAQEDAIKAHEKTLAAVTEERKGLEAKEADLRKELKGHNETKNGLEKTLDKQKQMKDRALEIEGLATDIGATSDAIADYEEAVKTTIAAITQLEGERSAKAAQIADLQSQKSQSFEKQKAQQTELGNLNAELAKESAKKNNLESRKIVIEEKVDELFEKSKDYGTLPPVTDDLSEPGLNDAIAKATSEKKSLEPVNLKSIEEYDVVKERWDEIDMRRQTLQRERKAIMDSIDRIELEKTRNFMKAYHEINRVFSEVFQKLSPGGSAKMILENPAHPFEGGITIEARPRGKKINSLEILSGGEKTLVALSFIFAIQNFYPAPFYIMDEIDAALDGPNVYRVSMVIKEYASQTQFLVISHREENITNSDTIYGVAMNDGVTDIFTVNLEDERKREDFGAGVEGMEEEEEIVSENRELIKTDDDDPGSDD